MKYIASINGKEYFIEIAEDDCLIIDGQELSVDFKSISEQPVYSLLVDSKSYEAHVFAADDDLQVLLLGRLFQVKVIDEREKRLREAVGGNVVERGEFLLKAPMPGLIVSVAVHEGQKINKGDVLVILESMKMQNELKSPRNGVVSRLKIKLGDNVEQRQTLLSVV